MRRRPFLIGGGALALAGGAAYARQAMGSMSGYDASVASMRAALPAHPDSEALIRYATLAPNGHNTQPWRFRIGQGSIDILPDLSRRTPVVDPDDHHLFVALGCAGENLSLAAAACGRPGELRARPQDGGIAFVFGSGQAPEPALFDAIPRRQSTRADYDGRPAVNAEIGQLADAAAVAGVNVVFITDRPGIDRVRDLVLEGNSAQMADPAFVRELRTWLRFSPRAALRTGDGLFTVASGHPSLPDWLGPTMFDLTVGAASENDSYARQLQSSSGVAVFVAEQEGPDDWVRVGRACQRFALQATALGLKHAFVNQPVEVARLRPQLADLVGMPGRRPDLVMRFGFGPTLPFSARRPVQSVLEP